jgi:hypothetical protein
MLGGHSYDLAVLTERQASAIRIYAIDAAGRLLREAGAPRVFEGETGDHAAPMGIALYRGRDGTPYAIVGRKFGPLDAYLWQYSIKPDFSLELVRKFGRFSGKGEIEAIAVDQEMGFVYYADEGAGIRKYYADPTHPEAQRELGFFGRSGYHGDREGLAIHSTGPGAGYLISTDQIEGGSRYFPYRRTGDQSKPVGVLEGPVVLARGEWRAQGASPGTGVVLWSGHSLLGVGQAKAADVSAATRLQDVPPGVQVGAPLQATVYDLKLHVSLIPDRGPVGVRETMMRETSTSLNYSLLHNDRTPFKSFLVEKLAPGRLPPLQIEVALEVGDELCRCKFSEELPDGCVPVEFAKRIRLPLVAGLLRHCTESLRTNLYIRVTCGDRLLEESSRRVTVLPADEWRDDGEDHRWLPSFVLPRDPAVLKVIDAAQRYLRTLLDDCAAGFDGYQRLAADDSNAADIVDPQVQAIWAALQHDLPINYINPPPSYTSQSQRLRSPSEIFRGRAATCIDLALLFASCLEFVGIYPVVFLIAGHAFPGYWRSDKAWWRMTQFRFPDAAATGELPPEPRPEASTTGQTEAWMFNGVDNLGELLRYVQSGALVPFESTFVSAQRGFVRSLEEGAARLHPETFDAMIDVQSARAWHVTPLPLFDKFS